MHYHYRLSQPWQTTYLSYNNKYEDTAVTRDSNKLHPHPMNSPDIRPVRVASKIPESDVNAAGESQNDKW